MQVWNCKASSYLVIRPGTKTTSTIRNTLFVGEKPFCQKWLPNRRWKYKNLWGKNVFSLYDNKKIINLIKNAKKSIFIIEKNPKYRKCPAQHDTFQTQRYVLKKILRDAYQVCRQFQIGDITRIAPILTRWCRLSKSMSFNFNSFTIFSGYTNSREV